MDGLTVRVLKAEELEALPKFWKDSVGVPVELRFLKRWYQWDPEGFRVAVNSSGRILGMATVMKQNDTLYVMGYMGVDKEFRSKGIAKRLLANVISRSPSASYALNASGDKISIYLRRGFKVVEDSYAYAYVGKYAVVPEKTSQVDVEFVRVTPESAHVNEMGAYDQETCGFKRNVALLHLGDSNAICMMVKRKGKVVGYGKIQHYLLGGAWLGPVYADDALVARWLIDSLVRQFESQRCTFLFTVLSEQARPIAQSYKMMLADKLSRCYLKPDSQQQPPPSVKKVFAFDDPGFTLF